MSFRMSREGNGSRASLLLAVLIILSIFSISSAQEQTVGASVQVSSSSSCSTFNITLNTLATYSTVSNVLANYTVSSYHSCSFNNLNGHFTLSYASNGIQVLSEPISVQTVNSVKETYPINNLDFSSLAPGSYVANAVLSTGSVENYSTTDVLLLAPSSVNFTSFTLPGSVAQGLPVTFSARLFNSGNYASSPITITINITGAATIRLNQTLDALSPDQGENLSITLDNASSNIGTYKVTITGVYNTSNQQDTESKIAPISGSYSVYAPPSGPGPQQSVSLPASESVSSLTQQLVILALPIVSSVSLGSTSSSLMQLQNGGKYPEVLNLSVAKSFSSMVQLSVTSIYLIPNNTAIIQLLVNAKNVSPGSYVIPINITTTPVNGSSALAGSSAVATTGAWPMKGLQIYAPTATGHLQTYALPAPTRTTIYVMVRVTNQTATSGLSTQTFINGNNLTVSFVLKAPPNQTFHNSTIITQLPPLLVKSLSQISATGLMNNISLVNGVPEIKWSLGSLLQGQSQPFSLTIANPSHLNLVSQLQTFVLSPTQPEAQSLLRVVNIAVPTFYTNETNRITVQTVYTGTKIEQVGIELSPPAGINVADSYRLINVTPNQLLYTTFNITGINVSGTYLFNVYAVVGNSTLSYAVPVVALARTQLNQHSSTLPSISLPSWSGDAVAFLLIVAAIIAVLSRIRSRRRGRGSSDNMDRMRRMKEQINREVVD